MKNTAINNLQYTGIVTLSQYIGNKKIEIYKTHNAGGSDLFNFLSDCLLGDFEIAKTNRPTKIMLLSKNLSEDGTTTYESKSGFIYLLSSPEKVITDSECRVRYSFTIPRDIIEGNDFESIGLYANSTNKLNCSDVAAIANLTSAISNSSLALSSALVVDWELIISNRGV